MHSKLAILPLVMLWSAASARDLAGLPPGFYGNEEQVYFDREAKRPAPPLTCMTVRREAVRKEAPKPNGSADWHLLQSVKHHDQGARAWQGKDVAGVKPAILCMRYIVWVNSESASSHPSLVLYVHAPNQPDNAVSYSWTDECASRVGINLRWMQASCTVDGGEKPSQIGKSSFRG